MLNGLQETMRDFLQRWVEDIFGSNLFESALNILKMNPSTAFELEGVSSLWGVITNVYNNVCVPIAMGLVLIYFMVNLIERSMQQQQLDIEQVIKLLLKLVVGLYFIKNGLELMSQIYSLGLSFLNSVVDVGADSTDMDELRDTAWEYLTGEKWNAGDWGWKKMFKKGIPALAQLFFPWLGSLVLKVTVSAVCYFRLIEFYISTCMAPIALSDFFTEGTHSNGWKFVKNYIALSLQLGVIMLAVVVFNRMYAVLFVDTSNYASFLVKFFALGFSCVGVMLKSRTLAKEIVGAQ